jgi:hypothetical protein
MKLTSLGSPYRLTSAALARVQKLLDRGRKTPFGADLAKHRIDQDYRLISWLSAQARPITGEIV